MRNEPILEGPATPRPGASRTGADEFRVLPGDRASLSSMASTPQTTHAHGDERSRAPLSADPNVQRAATTDGRSNILGKIVAAASVAALIGVLAPWYAQYLPQSLTQLWASPDTGVREVPPQALTPPSLSTDPIAAAAVAGAATAGTVGTTGEPHQENPAPALASDSPQEVGTARLAKPIAPAGSAAKTPPRAPSPATESNLALATKGMTAAPVPAPASVPQTSTPKPVAPPQLADAKPTQKPAHAPKAAAPAKQSDDDFMAMMNRAVRGATPATAAGGDADEASAAGQLVLSVQEKLLARGFDPGAVDGRAGAKTTEAIRSFQHSVGMTENGQIDMALMERLGIVGKRLQFPGR